MSGRFLPPKLQVRNDPIKFKMQLIYTSNLWNGIFKCDIARLQILKTLFEHQKTSSQMIFQQYCKFYIQGIVWILKSSVQPSAFKDWLPKFECSTIGIQTSAF